MQQLVSRMIRAGKLDINLYEEVEHDLKATPQAMLAVIIASLAAGIGLAIREILMGKSLLFFNKLVIGTLVDLVGWFIWSFVTYILGITLFKTPETEATYGQLLRTIGFSASPGVFKFFVFIPALGSMIGSFASIWQLVAMVIAVRQALDFKSTLRAVFTCIAGWIILAMLFFSLL